MNSLFFIKKRKLMSILIFVIILLGFLAKNISGHIPGRFWLAYDFATETLSIDIEHPRMYPDLHYIDNVVIWKNDVLVRNETYTSQLGDNYHLYFVINASHLDVFKGYGRCNIGGNATDTITVIDPNAPSVSSSLGFISGFSICLVMLGIGTIILATSINNRYKKKN